MGNDHGVKSRVWVVVVGLRSEPKGIRGLGVQIIGEGRCGEIYGFGVWGLRLGSGGMFGQ